MLLDRARRNIKHLNLEDKPASIYLKKPKQSKTKSYSIHHTFYYPAGTEPTKEFLYGQKRLVGDQIEYNDQVLFAELRVGDFFGGKSI